VGTASARRLSPTVPERPIPWAHRCGRATLSPTQCQLRRYAECHWARNATACPHVTWAHADVTQTASEQFAVRAERDESARGETIEVEGEDVTLDRARMAREDDDVAQDTPVWRGDRPAG